MAVQAASRVPGEADAVWAWGHLLWRRFGTARWARALVTGEHQHFGVDGQQLGGGFLELPACRNPWTNGVEPFGGNGLDAFLAARHESERPKWMAVPIGTMTGGLSAAAVGKRKRARKRAGREMEAGQQ